MTITQQRCAGAVSLLEGLWGMGTASAEEEPDHPVCKHSQELSGMWDPEITLAGALAPKDCCCFSLHNAVYKAKNQQAAEFQ